MDVPIEKYYQGHRLECFLIAFVQKSLKYKTPQFKCLYIAFVLVCYDEMENTLHFNNDYYQLARFFNYQFCIDAQTGVKLHSYE